LLIFYDDPPSSPPSFWWMELGIMRVYTDCFHISSECERCIALLEASVSVLLHCLEMVDTNSVVRKEYFSWELEEGVKCACFLRRIYEEVCNVCVNIPYH
jgi:hypothetical protein